MLPGLGKFLGGVAEGLFRTPGATGAEMAAAARNLSTTRAAVSTLRGRAAASTALGGRAAVSNATIGVAASAADRAALRYAGTTPAGYGGLLPKLAIGAGIYGAAKGLDFIRSETRFSEDGSGIAKFGMGTLSLGMKLAAGHQVLKGAMGSAAWYAGRIAGNTSKFKGAYNAGSKMLDRAGMMALKAPLKFAAGLPKFAFKTAVSIPYAAGGMVAGTGGMVAKAFGAKNISLGALTRPTYGLGLVKGGIFSKEAPMYRGAFAVGAAMGMAGSAMQHKGRNQSWVPSATGGTNPANYGMGIQAMRRGPSKNYGPSLTLMLHQNHSRVMP